MSAQVLQPHVFVLRESGNEFRHHAPQFAVGIVRVLKLLQLRHHRVPTALRDTDREHDEERIKPRLFDDDPVFGEVFRHDGRRDSRFRKVPRHRKPRRHHRPLDGIKHVKALGHRTESMPFVVRLQRPIRLRPHTGLREFIRAPHGEPPVVIALPHFAHGAAESTASEWIPPQVPSQRASIMWRRRRRNSR